MTLTADILRAAYAYLAETDPFVGWNLPDAEDVGFEVVTNKTFHGACWAPKMTPTGKFHIAISGVKHNHTQSLMLTMAHEMVHVHEYQTALRKPSYRKHGKVFRGFAAEVCAEHGFDPGQF